MTETVNRSSDAPALDIRPEVAEYHRVSEAAIAAVRERMGTRTIFRWIVETRGRMQIVERSMWKDGTGHTSTDSFKTGYYYTQHPEMRKTSGMTEK